MSYILDALRRAESERERGSVPTLHAQPAGAGSADVAGRPAAGARLWLGLAAGGALLLLLGALAARWFMPAERSGATPPPLQAAAPAAPAPPTASAALLPPTLQTPPAAPDNAPPGPGLVRLDPAEAQPAALPPSAAVARPVAAERPLPTLQELPEELRRQLPALTSGGAMYSATPANRMLIVNGQLLHEGDAVAPGLLLEQIRLNAAVLSFKGQRFSIKF